MKMKLLALHLLWALLPAGLTLKCHQCSGVPYNCQESTQLCYLNQTSCMSQSFSFVAPNGTIKEWTYKGCSQGLVCNETTYINTGNNKTYISSQCCSTDMCNSGTYYARVPVAALRCQACDGNSSFCSRSDLSSIQCAGVQDRCMTITTLFDNVTTFDTVIKGCGTGNLCGRRLQYNAGGVNVYTEVSCCGKNNCNQGLTLAVPDKTPNGLQCQACNETGKGECKTPITTSCTGNMTMCVDVVGFPRLNTIMRGCVSPDVCFGLSASMSIQASQKLYCCNNSLCNNGVVASYFKSGSPIILSSFYITGLNVWLLIILRTLL
ncbi:urokinase plasminogen activator surface receptor-like [Gastrophryne carolinensis]